MRQPAARRENAWLAAAVPLLDRSVTRALAAGVAVENRLGFARSFTFRVAAAYAASLYPTRTPLQAPEDLRLVPLDHEMDGIATQFGGGLAGIPATEAAYLLGCIYTSALPVDFRAAHGVFYTPPEIVRHTLDMAERAGTDWREARCLDPSAGGGAFIIEMIRRIRIALAGTDPAFVLSQIATRVRGYDVDPFGVWLGQAIAHFVVHDLEAASGRRLGKIVRLHDSLEVRPDDRSAFDLVSSNVPFGRITLPPERRALYARSTYGHANLYGLFADAGLHYAAKHGLLAFVMPTSMLSGLYFQSLRALLARAAPPHEITFVTERAGVFDDALQETMLATYCKGRHTQNGKVHFLTVDSNGQAHLTNAGGFSLPAVETAPWILPRTADRADLAERLRGMKFRLASYGYTVSTGPLVWNRHKPQFRPKPEPDCVPVVWAEALTSDGRFIWRADRRGHAPWFMPRPGKDDWLIVRDACVLLQRTTAKEQDRRLIAAEMTDSFIASHGGGVTIENHLNMIRTRADRPDVSPAVIAVILNSAATDAAFRCISGSVAVSAFELEELPLPAPATMRKIAALLDRAASKMEIELVIDAAYGLSHVAAAA